MHRSILLTALLGCSFAASPAVALTCYRIIDRNDNLVYQDTFPPIDLSERGNVQRDEMRAKGQHLIAMESEKCPTIEFFTGSAGNTALTIDQVVAGMNARDMMSAAPGSPRATPSAIRGGSSGPATPSPAPATKSAPPKY